MIIRKKFKFEGSHIVRDCSSNRCKKSLHGHSYVVEVFFSAIGLDNGQMLVDFGLLKGTIKDFIDSFDHCHSMWIKEKEEDKQFFRQYGERVIELPCSPSAEMYSLMFLYVIDKIIKNTQWNNGERSPQVVAVRVHETETGYAEACQEDLDWWEWTLNDIVISNLIKEEWKDPQMWDKLKKGIKFINPIIELKYQN